MIYTCPIEAVFVGFFSADKTVAGITVPDSAGNRCCVLGVVIGGANNPTDVVLTVELKRIADVSAGAVGTATAISPVPKSDTGGPDSIITCKANYTGEPSAYEASPVWSFAVHHRAVFRKLWLPQRGAPVIVRDQMFGLLVKTEGGAGPAINGAVFFEVF